MNAQHWLTLLAVVGAYVLGGFVTAFVWLDAIFTEARLDAAGGRPWRWWARPGYLLLCVATWPRILYLRLRYLQGRRRAREPNG